VAGKFTKDLGTLFIKVCVKKTFGIIFVAKQTLL
jgi:hypothetical protein